MFLIRKVNSTAVLRRRHVISQFFSQGEIGSKASFTLSRCTPRWVPEVNSRRTGTNRDVIRVRSYIPGSATDQARFGAQIDHGMSR